MRKVFGWVLLFLASTIVSFGQKAKPVFEVVPLGVYGGIDERNLSAYLVAPFGTKEYVCLDAGTVHSGIEKAIEKGTFSVSSSTVLRQYIKGYCISHAHLDHVSGLIINSPADSTKTVYAIAPAMKMMQSHYFNDQTWANFGDSGIGKPLKKYHFETLSFGKILPISNTSMTVQAFPLSHVNPYESTAFLIKKDNNAVLYLGDTGPDAVEKTTNLADLWKAIAPLIQKQELKGIFIEVSFPNEQPDGFLFGHLTPKHLMKEMQVLAALTGKGALQKCKIIITHLKPPAAAIQKIKQQLAAPNDLGLTFVFPEQGVRMEL
ncbi:MBL fold metallo-hydrolase [Flavobacterium sp. RSSB_23]|uniref:MBL fold metallo-hydrolase n=1 Tax=Flavobacterium sp. RSSB_23 TaxID=3447668 RepID=UPI003F32A6CD